MIAGGMGDVDAAALGEDLRRAIANFARVVRRETGTPASAQSETLALLEQTGHVNVTALAERRQVAHQTMRTVVAQLAASGLVVRSPDPADGRSQLVSLSPAGWAALAQERALRASRIDGLIASRLSPQDRTTLRAAIVLLDRMIGEKGPVHAPGTEAAPHRRRTRAKRPRPPRIAPRQRA